MPKLKLTHAEYLQILAQRGDIEIDQEVLNAFLVTSKHPGTLVNRLNFASTCFSRSMADISEREKRILTNYQQWKDKGCSAWQGINALAPATLMYAATYASGELDTPEELAALTRYATGIQPVLCIAGYFNKQHDRYRKSH